MTRPAVTYEATDRIGLITLERPDNRNSMTPDLLDAFREATETARHDGEARCLVITGTGSCFSAGADFTSIVQRDGGARTRLPHETSFAMYEPFLSVLDIEVPVVAAMNGHAVGGGFGLALLCDIRIAHATSKYGANFAKIGLHSGLGISFLLPRLIGVSNATELLLTGRLVSGAEAHRLGIASSVEEDAEQVLPTALALATEIANCAPLAVRTIKQSIYRHLRWDVRSAALDEAKVQAETLATDDAREGVEALLGKRPPRFQGR